MHCDTKVFWYAPDRVAYFRGKCEDIGTAGE